MELDSEIEQSKAKAMGPSYAERASRKENQNHCWQARIAYEEHSGHELR